VNSDEQLVNQIRHGSRTAFEVLFERYREPVWRFFRRRTPAPEIAEELAQDTFLAVLQALPRFRERAAFRSFLFGTAYNLLHAQRRSAARRPTDPLDVEPADLATHDPYPGIWVRDALARLDEDDREILMLREYEQLSYQEIADLRGIPLNTVRSRLFRARSALRSALELQNPQALRTTHGGR
jgi:RNA polymerase sigma-70 factor (ECF subfamily)